MEDNDIAFFGMISKIRDQQKFSVIKGVVHRRTVYHTKAHEKSQKTNDNDGCQHKNLGKFDRCGTGFSSDSGFFFFLQNKFSFFLLISREDPLSGIPSDDDPPADNSGRPRLIFPKKSDSRKSEDQRRK